VNEQRFFETAPREPFAAALPVTTVGGWPRSPAYSEALRRRLPRDQRGPFPRRRARRVREALRAQLDAGVDLVTDGEQTRQLLFVRRRETRGRPADDASPKCSKSWKTGEASVACSATRSTCRPTFSISNPTCVGEVRLREPLAEDDFCYLRSLTDRPIKVTLPGPYLLTRPMWVPEASRAAYPDKEALGAQLAAILGGEVERLERAGADFIQFDEPVLTELLFSQGRTRTFMCAALAARKDPREELEFALSLLGRVLRTSGRVRTGLRVSRQLEPRQHRCSAAAMPAVRWFAYGREAAGARVRDAARGDVVEIGDKGWVLASSIRVRTDPSPADIRAASWRRRTIAPGSCSSIRIAASARSPRAPHELRRSRSASVRHGGGGVRYAKRRRLECRSPEMNEGWSPSVGKVARVEDPDVGTRQNRIPPTNATPCCRNPDLSKGVRRRSSCPCQPAGSTQARVGVSVVLLDDDRWPSAEPNRCRSLVRDVAWMSPLSATMLSPLTATSALGFAYHR
jgi:methionine synthase II (cobalamin-independent)